MARSAEETADILSKLFNQSFGQDYAEPYRITWPQLRSLAAIPRLNDSFLKGINEALSEFGQTLIILNNFLIIAREYDLDHYRILPDRILEEYLQDTVENDSDNDGQGGEDDDI
jgi:hypothetical protein